MDCNQIQGRGGGAFLKLIFFVWYSLGRKQIELKTIIKDEGLKKIGNERHRCIGREAGIPPPNLGVMYNIL